MPIFISIINLCLNNGCKDRHYLSNKKMFFRKTVNVSYFLISVRIRILQQPLAQIPYRIPYGQITHEQYSDEYQDDIGWVHAYRISINHKIARTVAQ